MLPKLINSYGIINVGGKPQSVYNFAKKYNKNTIKTKNRKINYPLKQTMSLKKLKKLLN